MTTAIVYNVSELATVITNAAKGTIKAAKVFRDLAALNQYLCRGWQGIRGVFQGGVCYGHVLGVGINQNGPAISVGAATLSGNGKCK